MQMLLSVCCSDSGSKRHRHWDKQTLSLLTDMGSWLALRPLRSLGWLELVNFLPPPTTTVGCLWCWSV